MTGKIRERAYPRHRRGVEKSDRGMEKTMISKKLKIIFGFSIPLFIAHGMEEYIMGFYDMSPDFLFVFSPLFAMPEGPALFLLLQIMVWLLLSISFLLIFGGLWPRRVMTLLGLLYVYELHHFIDAFRASGYAPGLITALVFPVFAVLFWREFWKTRNIETPKSPAGAGLERMKAPSSLCHGA